MHSITTFIKVLGFAVFLVVVQGCSEEGIIGEKDMAVIISEIYLADQALETKPELKMQTDSILVYPAIMERNGYTLEMYEKSMRYYMQEGDSYSNILKAAKERLTKREKELNRIIKEAKDVTQAKELEQWWGLDSVRSVNSEELVYDKLLRGIRWMVLRDEMKQDWRMSDSAVVDIPQNPQWWTNTLSAPVREYRSFFIRSTDNNDDKEVLNDEKDSGELPVPLRGRAASKKRIPGLKQLK